MREMANLDFRVLVNELQFLPGSRLQKIYELSPGVLRLHFYASGKGEFAFLIDLPLKRAHLASRLSDAPPATPFAMQLRKKLEGSRLEKFEQQGLDRILLLTFSTTPQITLAAELFGDGNIILFDSSTKKIILSLRQEEWKDRTIRRGETYQPPTSTKTDPLTLTSTALASLIRSSPKQLIPALSEKLNVGASYLEEIVAQSKLPPSLRACDLTDAQARILFEAFIEIFAYISRPRPCVFTDKGGTNFSPFALDRFASLSPKCFSSFSEALEEYYSSASPAEQQPSPHEKQLTKLKFALQSQKKSIQLFIENAQREKERGDKLYEKFQDVESLLSFIREENKKGKEWPAIEEEAKKKFPLLQKLDPANGVAVVSL